MQNYVFTIIICVYYTFVDTQIFGKDKEVSVNGGYLRKEGLVFGWEGYKRLLLFPSFFLISCLFLLSNLNVIFYNKYTGLNVNKTKYNHTDTEALLDHCSVSNVKAGLLLVFSRLYISPLLRTVSFTQQMLNKNL